MLLRFELEWISGSGGGNPTKLKFMQKDLCCMKIFFTQGLCIYLCYLQ